MLDIQIILKSRDFKRGNKYQEEIFLNVESETFKKKELLNNIGLLYKVGDVLYNDKYFPIREIIEIKYKIL